MGSQGTDVADTHLANEGEAAGELVECEPHASSYVHNDSPSSHSPVVVTIVPSVNLSPQASGYCSDTQHKSHGEAVDQSNYVRTGCDEAGTNPIRSFPRLIQILAVENGGTSSWENGMVQR
ncbi:hypothetical protein V6N11_050755 [Hibiscus sabdariffa]|uniref:Uncharacterized protein n=1 Tax=Hibiscus sabdariffa TaxID=183260 RepID=A0ABR2TBQ7_9ROSI